MHTVEKIAPFAYYQKESRRDYYRDGSIGAGEWFGRGAKALGLVGEVVRRAFHHMVQGVALDGTKLVRNWGDDRFVGHDHTFSANKYVSLAWALERSAAVRKGIEQAVVAATKDAMQFIEDTCLYSRTGRGGVNVVKATGMVSCLWLHATSRRDDPQLHCHAVLFNQVETPRGWGTILGITQKTQAVAQDPASWKQSRSAAYALRNEAGQVFQQSLRSRIEQLGYRTADADAKHGFWSIVGVSKQLADEFSSRSQDVKRHMQEHGVTGGKEASRSARLTRPPKSCARIEDLFAMWRQQARGFDPATIRLEQAEVRAAGPVVSEELRTRAEAKAELHVAAPLPRQRAASSSNGFKYEQGEPSDRHRQASQAGQVRAQTGDDEKTLRAAAAVARILRSSRSRSTPLTAATVWAARLQVEYLDRTQFTQGEKAALADITRRRGAVQSLGCDVRVEPVLKAAGIGWHRQGKKVVLVTDSHRERERLEKETGLHAITTAGLLRGLSENRGLLAGYDAALKKSLRLPLGFRSGGIVNYTLKAAAGKWLSLDRKTVLVVESSSLELTERAELLKKVQKAGAKIVFVDRTREAKEIPERLVRPRPVRDEMRRRYERDRDHEQENEQTR